MFIFIMHTPYTYHTLTTHVSHLCITQHTSQTSIIYTPYIACICPEYSLSISWIFHAYFIDISCWNHTSLTSATHPMISLGKYDRWYHDHKHPLVSEFR
jgi:hypothetical protein